ncbi:MAG: hypothetical protein SFY80_11560 [Verrucomicrobiota bacterium]|nr:hypothetical protein [Verrucomicrobiota bacterium]
MIRSLFNALSLRERVLLTAFFWVGLLFWISSVARGLMAERTKYVETRGALEAQDNWLAQKPVIDERLPAIKAQFVADKTYNGVQLAARVDHLAREAKLDREIGSLETENSDISIRYSVRLQVRRAQIAELIALDTALQKDRPYIALESFQIQANSRDPKFLDATFQVTAFELNSSTLK